MSVLSSARQPHRLLQATILPVALGLLMVVGAACSDLPNENAIPLRDTTAVRDTAASQRLVQTLRANQRFSIFTTMLDSAGLTPTLQSGTYTVFAPTDSGLEQMPNGLVDELLLPDNRERLTSILRFHLHRGRITAEDVQDAQSIPTLSRRALPITVEGGRLMIGERIMTEYSVPATNGIIYATDVLAMPPLEPPATGKSSTANLRQVPLRPPALRTSPTLLETTPPTGNSR